MERTDIWQALSHPRFLTNEATNMAERSAIVQDLAWRSFGTSKKMRRRLSGAVSDLFCGICAGRAGYRRVKGHRKVDGRSERRLYSLFPGRICIHAHDHSVIRISAGGLCGTCRGNEKAVQIPVIAVGRINDVEIAESVLQSKRQIL